MANCMDYLDWRGDLSFTADPFNEVDNYICSQFCMPEFDMIVPENGQRVTLADTVERYGTLWGKRGDKLGVLSSPYVLPLLRRAVETERFAGTELSHYVNLFDEDKDEQFSALCIHLPDGSTYIAYRGTDDTLTGWKEDFLMCVLDEVSAQSDALDYLRRVAAEVDGSLRLGGHSKGGNLAMFAAVNAEEEIQNRILAVYNNDGPGFRADLTETEGFRRMKDRMVTILPQHSIVGTLLSPLGESVVVNSSRKAPESHDGFYWQVMGNRFVRCGELSRYSRALDEAVDRTMEDMDSEERREFVESLFEALSSTGARTLTELTGQGIRRALEVLHEGRRSSAVQSFLGSVAELTVRELADEMAEDVRERMPELHRPLHRKKNDTEDKSEEEPEGSAKG